MEDQIFELTAGIHPSTLRGLFLAVFFTAFWITALVVTWKHFHGAESQGGSIKKASMSFIISSLTFMFLLGITLIF